MRKRGSEEGLAVRGYAAKKQPVWIHSPHSKAPGLPPMGIGVCRPRWEAPWGKVTTAAVYLAFATCQWLTRIIITHITLLISRTSSEDGLYNPSHLTEEKTEAPRDYVQSKGAQLPAAMWGSDCCPAHTRVPGGERAGGPGSGQSQVRCLKATAASALLPILSEAHHLVKVSRVAGPTLKQTLWLRALQFPKH